MIHPTAIVSKESNIDKDVEIGPFCIIEKGVRIEKGTVVMNGVVIRKGTIIGKNNKIFPYVIIGEEPQDKSYRKEDTEVEIGNGNEIREFVTIHRAVGEGKKTKIGDKNYIMTYSHIGHNAKVGNSTIIVNGATLGGYAEVGSYAYLSAYVALHQFTRVGAYAIVGGGYRVIKDVIPFALAAGEPLRIVSVNTVGLRRNNFSQERREIIKDTFRILFRSNLNTRQAIEKIENQMPMNEDIRLIIDFIKTSKRGIVKGG